MTETKQPDINNIKKAIRNLESLDQTSINNDYAKIICVMKEYLYNYCIHDWDEDYVDISLDSSMKIHYCKNCHCDYYSYTQYTNNKI